MNLKARLFLKYLSLAAFVLLGTLTACEDDEKPKLNVPDTYEFERDGQSSVFYGGQTDRLNQTSELKSYLQQGDGGAELESEDLQAMFENADGDGGGNFSFTSDRQLKDKTFAADVSFYEDLFVEIETASKSGADAAQGVAGLIERANGNTILVSANGHEYTQLIEKGIMGSVFLNQIYNVYLTDGRIGNDVENTELDGSNNYTKMEHHWDEAFGYYGVPVDFPTTKTNRFWGNYSNGRDGLLQTNSMLMGAFLTGRAAIVAKQYNVRDEQRDVIYEGFELVAASTAVHYLNDAKDAFAAQETGEGFHVLSEAYMFIKALRLSPRKKITDAQLEDILETHIGEDFWEVAESDLSGLDEAISVLVTAYPELASIKDSL